MFFFMGATELVAAGWRATRVEQLVGRSSVLVDLEQHEPPMPIYRRE